MGATERREREKEARKNHILKAARTLLLKKGLHETTVNQIAKLSELSVGTIYLYYHNKEDIFAALQEEGLEILNRFVSEVVAAAATPAERIRAIATAYVDFSEKNKSYYDIITYFLSSPGQVFPARLKSRIDKTGGKVLNHLIDSVEAGIRSGDFRKVNTLNHSLCLWGTLHGLIQFNKLEKTILRNEKYRDLINYAVESFLEGLRKQ
ncbi:MAG TPA: TetR/AcrR family transcriptional regulator [Spirochaetota bacterium]|nr:TetR/AcrR family transcriptional regulator [Spirochaetota bacterium]HOD14391.1 TetR/AcrR family transcriptional regulator [Spirochaetota bacterium]HPG50992.1 TetR/AcrR family transcriptional regulator [Spirochaetota bacterium]HPN11751.1 TetR/AcrR family transcriptional regulator [Spirochaetota bacterium]HQL81911.1 TetR/AcrR family transcriptional regulator [Spirochaetota bacterium]